VRLEVFPHGIVLAPGEHVLFCLGWRFPSGRIALRTQDRFRSISAYQRTCDSEYRSRFTRLETAVTAAEQEIADSRIGEVWTSGDTTVVTVEPLVGGVLPRVKFALRWIRWSQDRTGVPPEEAIVYLGWRGQLVTARVLVRSTGWYVRP
jgi:hypothetical protein